VRQILHFGFFHLHQSRGKAEKSGQLFGSVEFESSSHSWLDLASTVVAIEFGIGEGFHFGDSVG
jgi:hypothetical protein